MERKILGILKPFLMKQEFYVYEDGNKIDVINCFLNEIPNVIITLANKYNTNKVELFGAKSYSLGIKKQIQEKEISLYNISKLDIILK